MGVLDFHNSVSFCLQQRTPIYSSFEGFNRRRKFVAMSSTIPVEQVNNAPLQLTADSFIRQHLRELAPYQPILPFEVRPFVPSLSFINATIICHCRFSPECVRRFLYRARLS